MGHVGSGELDTVWREHRQKAVYDEVLTDHHYCEEGDQHEFDDWLVLVNKTLLKA